MLISVCCLLFKLINPFVAYNWTFYHNLTSALGIVAVVCTVASIILLVAEFLFYKQFIDPIMPKRKTCNVVCTRKAAGETKRRIVIGGHIDSAYEWRYTHIGGAKMLTTMIILVPPNDKDNPNNPLKIYGITATMVSPTAPMKMM